MPSRFGFNRHNTLVLLPCIFYCASCAPQQKLCVRCALSCDDADVHELKKHPSVRVDVECLSEPLHHDIYSVSSLYTGGGRCSVVVPDCSKWDRPITLRIYADESSFEPFYEVWDVKPDKLTEDKVNSVTEDVEITGENEMTVTERVLMLAGVALAVFVFFLTTIVAGGIIYHRGQQKGWTAVKHAALIHQKHLNDRCVCLILIMLPVMIQMWFCWPDLTHFCCGKAQTIIII